MKSFILTEKPSACLKIATALSDGKIKKNSDKGAPYYEITHDGKDIIVGCAVGHLFGLAEKEKKGWTYPVYDVEWKPSYINSKSSKFTKKYYDTIKKTSKDAKEFYLATDKDIEGELLGYNILRYICNVKDAKRMEFSTLTKDDLIKSFKEAKPHVDFPLIEAGETRHILDWIHGINTSRALTLSIKNATKQYKLLSTGRVQGPTLKLIVDKEKEIKAFIPVPYWEIEADLEEKEEKFIAYHEQGKFEDKENAENIFNKVNAAKKAKIIKVSRSQFKQTPPAPFDLTSLQTEAYRNFRIQPSRTLEIAQSLYLAALISYPRTSSQQLPPALNYKKIIKDLSKQENYKELCNELLKEKLNPNNGKKTDPAHPAIHPTGELPETLSEEEQELYDLIVRRTLAAFAKEATRETMTVDIDINKEIFISKGTRTVDKGWHKFYGKYATFKEETLPDLKENKEVKVIETRLLSKETQPPKRYTPASIIKLMETLNLGTKATRSSIVETLYSRHYIKETSLEATNLGIKTIETLEKYCPEIIDVALTEHFEEEMNEIQEQKKKSLEVIAEAKETLNKIFTHFKENEHNIGLALSEAVNQTRDDYQIVGKCDKCKEGDLRIMFSKRFKSYFIACSKYPDCKNTFSMPKNGLAKPTGTVCPECGFPVIKIIRKGKRPYDYCINKNCKLKEEWAKQQLNSE